MILMGAVANLSHWMSNSSFSMPIFILFCEKCENIIEYGYKYDGGINDG